MISSCFWRGSVSLDIWDVSLELIQLPDRLDTDQNPLLSRERRAARIRKRERVRFPLSAAQPPRLASFPIGPRGQLTR